MSSPSKVSHAAGYAVIILLLVGGTAFLLNSRIGGVQVYDVYPTPSMRPTLEVGDLVVAQSVAYDSIHVGDVIIYSPPLSGGGCEAEVIVHRVVNITSQGLITQGDNRITNPRPDEPDSWPPVTPECVKGLVVVSVPFLGKISEAFPPPLNYILVAAIVVLIFMIELYSSSKEEGKKDGEAEKTETPLNTLYIGGSIPRPNDASNKGHS
ncbi:MAG: signal peptidase I [Thaumarchaeota archaeon]|nr:signal peptidase I [Nitrososphaerota archaeon]